MCEKREVAGKGKHAVFAFGLGRERGYVYYNAGNTSQNPAQAVYDRDSADYDNSGGVIYFSQVFRHILKYILN